MRCRQFLWSLSVALVSTGLAHAQPATADSVASPTIPQTVRHIALADELVEAAQIARTQMATVPQIVEMMMPIMLRGNEEHAVQVRQILGEEMNRAFINKRAALLKVSRDAFANNFTDAELVDLLAFYRSPTGKRYVELQPKLVRETLTEGQKVGREAAQEAIPFILDRLRKANLKVPERT